MAPMLSADSAPTRRLADTLSTLYRRVIGESDRPRLQRVGVVVVDGLGSELIQQASGHARFLAGRLREHGTIGHSGLPSTTASALASVTTGELAGSHGLLGYQVRDPHSGAMVNHLKPFPDGVTPRDWQPLPTVFEQAASHSIPSLAVGESRFSGTDFSESILRGAQFAASADLDGHVHQMRGFFDNYDEAVAYLYWPALDRIGHQLGVGHSNWVDALERVDAFARTVHAQLKPGEAIVFTADHGMVDVEASHQVWMPSGHPLRSQVQMWAGEPRLVQLYLTDDADVDQFCRQFTEFAAGRLSVLTRDDAVARGLFGDVVDDHRQRLGDVLVFAEDHYALYDELTATETSKKMVGQHGSWTTREVSIPLIPLGAEGL